MRENRPNLYNKFEKTQLILRDELAIDRTLLANERTLLAYLRSGVALLIAGVTIIHFADENWFLGVGVACLPTGAVCGVVGVLRFLGTYRTIQAIRNKIPIRSEGEGDEDQ
jgi:putative membrane protein